VGLRSWTTVGPRPPNLLGVWVAGIAWRGGQYEVVVVDGQGRGVAGPSVFDGRRVGELVRVLLDHAALGGGALGCVVDSTNGTLDGHLMAAGLTVYRADPWALPERPPHGSVPARVLAATDPAGLTRLRPETGSLGGRDAEYAAAVAACAVAEGELARSGQWLVRGSGTRPEVALTFDDGPHPVFTPRVLDILARYRIRATFFCVGLCAVAYPELVARIVEEGHHIGNHTWSHPYLPDLTRDELLRQIDTTGEVLGGIAGTVPVMMRPPYASRTPEVLRWLADRDLTMVLFDVDTRDWTTPGADAIVAAVTTAAAPGSIVLMHDAGGDRTQTVAALPRIVEGLLGRELRFVTVDRIG
jgi:peptidoglycan/xylan/chitin deacetylase (PgdA/CDA1 family)